MPAMLMRNVAAWALPAPWTGIGICAAMARRIHPNIMLPGILPFERLGFCRRFDALFLNYRASCHSMEHALIYESNWTSRDGPSSATRVTNSLRRTLNTGGCIDRY